ncbi:TrmH family RNA methyltransferase [Aliihoeflea aestuarii]|uniref:TrmH family RNA methyltransferase n=1 Tax=Aliihoeflea aestuarii TaxID=453840 RepID=UPI002094FB68|nr:RNA methyltransferase [Aliihoeflea aestuarii]
MTTTIPISAPDDPRIAAYRNVRERDLVGREGRFVAEGKVVLNVLFAARRFTAESALILDKRLDGVTDTLALAPSDLPVYVADQATMDAIAGFHIHRGILAIGRKRVEDDALELLAALHADALVVVLVGISNHDNVGAIFRNAAAFGADAVILDRESCDPLYRKAIRVSVGAALKIPYAVMGDAEAIHACLAEAGFEQLAMTPRDADDILRIAPTGRQAIYLGAEGPGLPEDLMARMRRVRIDMEADFDSLNVAAASAVALHRLRRTGRAAIA